MNNPLVGIIMGSKSDLGIMKEAAMVLEELEIAFEINIMSAHRTPHKTMQYAESARSRGLKVIIAGAGGAAHLAGVVTAFTTLPVIGVPVNSSISIDGWDSILSMLQMPPGMPVATVALDGARNAGILAAEIIGAYDEPVRKKLDQFRELMREKVEESARELEKKGYREIK